MDRAYHIEAGPAHVAGDRAPGRPSRRGAWVAASVLAITLLAACGGGSAATTAASPTSADAGSASVATATSAAPSRRGPGGGQSPAAFRAAMQTTLDPLVRDNTLSSTQETAILDALSQRPARGSASSVSGSASTAPAATAVASAGTSVATTAAGSGPGRPGSGGFGGFQKRALDPLVQQGTITATQETTVLRALQQAATARRPGGTPTPGTGAGA